MVRRASTLVFLLVLAGAGLILASCGDNSGTTTPQVDEYQALIEQFGLAAIPTVPYPDNNRFFAERVALGRLLFFDPILGGESAPWIKSAAGKDPYRFRANDIACATCHLPQFGFADGRRLGAGVGGAHIHDTDIGPDRVVPGRSLVTGLPIGEEPRNSMSVLNAACNGQNSMVPSSQSFQFMDGRVTKGLEQQAGLPITSREEMAGDAYDIPAGMATADVQAAIQDSVARRVAAIPEYAVRFKQAFPLEVHSSGDITIDQVTRAVAAYEREIVTPNSRYDQFIMGNRGALNEVEKQGFKLFFGKGKCGDCHNGPMLSDFTFRVQGVGDDYDSVIPNFGGKSGTGQDFGRFHAPGFGSNQYKYAFRVISIRDAELTAPYFHSGSAGTLREAVEFYNRGGRGPQDVSDQTLAAVGQTRDPSITPLGLTDQEIDDIVAFMKSTTAPIQQGPLGIKLTEEPQRVPSGLLPPGVPTPDGPGPFYPAKPLAGLQ